MYSEVRVNDGVALSVTIDILVTFCMYSGVRVNDGVAPSAVCIQGLELMMV